MFTIRDIVWGIAAPALIALLTMVVAWRPWRGQSPLAGGFWAGSMALAAGFAAAFVGIVSRSPIPPREAADWLFAISLVCAFLGLLDAVVVIPTWIRRFGAWFCLTGFAWLLLHPLGALDLATKIYWTIGLAALATTWWMWLDDFAGSHRGALVPALLLIVSSADGLVLMLSSSKLFGQLGGAIAAATGSCLIVSLFSRSVSLARGGVFTFVSLISGLLICGHFYADLTWLNGGLLIAAGFLAAAGRFLPAHVLHGWKRTLVLLTIVLVPAGVAVALAAIEFAASMSESGY